MANKSMLVKGKSTNLNIKVIQEPYDGITNRISIGGDAKNGYYFVFRGKIDEVKEALKVASTAFHDHENYFRD